jgi:hypothetical protein
MRGKAVSGGLKIVRVRRPRSDRISPIHGGASSRAAAAQRARAPTRPAPRRHPSASKRPRNHPAASGSVDSRVTEKLTKRGNCQKSIAGARCSQNRGNVAQPWLGECRSAKSTKLPCAAGAKSGIREEKRAPVCCFLPYARVWGVGGQPAAARCAQPSRLGAWTPWHAAVACGKLLWGASPSAARIGLS